MTLRNAARNLEAESDDKRLQVLDEVAGPKTSNRKRFFGLLAFLGFAMAILELIRFLQKQGPIHAGMAVIWLTVGALWGFRFRHFGETRTSVKVPK
ncbi:MAG TPA: hypothetical protein VH079_06365 [Terriglobales bacterium]|nr:hypothetical protein [Terriglobales bacterium]